MFVAAFWTMFGGVLGFFAALATVGFISLVLIALIGSIPFRRRDNIVPFKRKKK